MRSLPSGAARHGRRAPHHHHRGFTLVELVAVLLIVGSLGTIVMQVFRDLRYDARRASLDGIRTAIIANTTQARAAWMVQGGGSSVTIGGRTIEVYAVETVDNGYKLPAGSPTAAGMYAMLNCGQTPYTPTWTPSNCATTPGWYVGASATYLGFWYRGSASAWSSSWCAVGYWPAYGYDPAVPVGPHPTDSNYNKYQSTEEWTRPLTTQAGGC